MSTEPGDALGYPFADHVIEPRLCDITATNAAVIVNSIGSRASSRNPIARAILAAAGNEVKQAVSRYAPSGRGVCALQQPGVGLPCPAPA